MPFEYISTEDAIARKGLRVVVVGGVPSPWGEAAKGIFHIKGIEWAAVRLVYDDPALKKWAGQRNGPIAVWNDEPPRAGWAEILLLAERLAPAPSLLPADPAQRALALGLCHELCGEQGLGWSRRLQHIHTSLTTDGGYATQVGQYLGKKYGYTPEAGAGAGARTASLLRMLADRLKAQQQAGSPYYVGDALTAVDVYSAAFMAMFKPLPPEQCDMQQDMRAAFEEEDPETSPALDPLLITHRDRMYADHLELPLQL